jgi:hypothetical protein
MKTIATTFILCALGTSIAAGQIPVMGAEASPNPANVGQVITMTWEATQTVAFVSGCGYVDVRQGSPNGPVVYGSLTNPITRIIH